MATAATIDPELSAALSAVAESSAADRPKYGPETCGLLNRMIIGRTFGKPMLELGYLIVVAAACGRRPGRYEELLFNPQPALPAAFRARLQHALRGGGIGWLRLTGSGVAVGTDGEPFEVHFGRMPLLTALAEFLLTTVGYQELDAIVTSIAAPPVRARRIADAANALSRALHGWLQSRLDSTHGLRKMQAMLDFLAARGSPADAAAIDDAVILDFWLAWSGHDGEAEGFRTYRGVVTSFINLHTALLGAEDRDRIRNARSVGSDRDAGEVDPRDSDAKLVAAHGDGDDDEVDPEELEAALFVLDEEPELVAALSAPPLDRVKFLNQRELSALAAPALIGRRTRRLALSALRYDVFGDVQVRIGQALRRGALWRCEPDGDYAAVIDAYRQLAAHVERVMWASLHVLIHLRAAEVVDVMQVLRPGLQLAGPMTADREPAEGNVVRLGAASPVDRFLRTLASEPAALGPAVAEMAETARKAFARIARKGFAAEEHADPEVAEAFKAAPIALRRLAELLARFNAALAAVGDAAWAERYSGDYPIFLSQFERLYGGPRS